VAEQTIRFEDGAAYEQTMGIWSWLVGEVFLRWLALPSGLRWIDVGCGNGAFTELLVEQCSPQLAFARTRPSVHLASFIKGDAMALRICLGGGFPLDPIVHEMRGMGLSPPRAPRLEASRMQALQDLWRDAGLKEVEIREIIVYRTFENFDDFWMAKLNPQFAPIIAAMRAAEVETLKDRVRARLPADAEGRITYDARAHAIKGKAPE